MGGRRPLDRLAYCYHAVSANLTHLLVVSADLTQQMSSVFKMPGLPGRRARMFATPAARADASADLR